MSKERYVEHTVAWELPIRDSVTKGNYNLADIETKYLPIQTEVVSDNKDKTINKLQQRIAELEEQLENAIVLPIEIGDKCWTINCWCEYGDAKKGEPYTVTRYELHENIVSGYDIYKSMINNNLTLKVVPRAETNYKGVQPYLFATKEEATEKLRELQGEKK